VDREFLYRFEDEINRARYEIDEKYHMGQAELRARHLLAAAMEQINNATQPPPLPETPSMSITGLQQGAIQAKLAEVRQKAQERLNQGLNKIGSAQEQGLAKVDQAVDGVVEKINKEVDDQLQEFAQYTNGGPA
jgi:hypothetical protein